MTTGQWVASIDGARVSVVAATRDAGRTAAAAAFRTGVGVVAIHPGTQHVADGATALVGTRGRVGAVHVGTQHAADATATLKIAFGGRGTVHVKARICGAIVAAGRIALVRQRTVHVLTHIQTAGVAAGGRALRRIGTVHRITGVEGQRRRGGKQTGGHQGCSKPVKGSGYHRILHPLGCNTGRCCPVEFSGVHALSRDLWLV